MNKFLNRLCCIQNKVSVVYLRVLPRINLMSCLLNGDSIIMKVLQMSTSCSYLLVNTKENFENVIDKSLFFKINLTFETQLKSIILGYNENVSMRTYVASFIFD